MKALLLVPGRLLRTVIHHRINLLILSATAMTMILAYATNDIYPLGFLFPIGLYIIMAGRKPSLKASIYYGFFLGVFIAVGGFYWLIHTIVIYGHIPLVPAVLIFGLYALVFNAKFPVFFALYHYFKRMRLPVWFLFSGLFTLCEFLSWELFPWTIGASQYANLPFIQAAELGGGYLITFLVCIQGFALLYTYKLGRVIRHRILRSLSLNPARLFFGRPYRHISWTVVLLWSVIAANYLWGSARLQEIEAAEKKAPAVTVSMIQPSAPLQPNPEKSPLGARYSFNKLFTGIIQKITKLSYAADQAARAKGDKIDLLVIPEGAFPYLSSHRSPATGTRDTEILYNVLVKGEIYWSYLHRKLLYLNQNLQAPIFVNETDAELKNPSRRTSPYNRRHFNSSALYDYNGKRAADYHKVFLLPFGEYLPLPELWGLRDWLYRHTPVSDFAKGQEQKVIEFEYTKRRLTDEDGWVALQELNLGELQAEQFKAGAEVESESPLEIQAKRQPINTGAENSLTVGTQKATFVPAICYEILSGSFIRAFEGIQNAGMIINITNDRWFGDSGKETYQHLQLGIFRAVETRKPVVRSTNSGVSALVSSTGRIVQSTILGQTEESFKNLEVPQMKMQTLFLEWGNWPVTFLFFIFGGYALRPLGRFYRRILNK